MKRIFLLAAVLLSISFAGYAQDTAQLVVEGRKNSATQQSRPYVIMISIDGFRYDYAEKYNAQNLLRLSGAGVRATAMQPAFPSLTFPNHYSLATGLYPAHHGLVDNFFYDRKRDAVYKVGNRDAVEDGTWYNGVPLWVLAEKQEMISASYFWVGSESAIQNVRPTYYFKYQEKTRIDQRIQTVINWLRLPEEQRPHLITFYFPEVDHMGHSWGPDADSVRSAVQFVDAAIGKMVAEAEQLHLPVNFIVVSDHGMMLADTTHTITLPDAPVLQPLKSIPGNEKVMLYGKTDEEIKAAYDYLKQHENHYTAYLKKETPERWHYGQEDVYNRIGDIILLAEANYIFTPSKKASPGHHGYDNNLTNMNAIFMAWGPAFKPHTRIATFENVHVYPLVARILGLDITQPIDGRLEVLEPVLQ
ncbi:Predicted pyrophosphatase or phosphodiesterase, AlkP superfamily [Chitinophaga ginsengisegetis]|uniref:Predicted pyrophosphatase or phosphodiesterase, AlkP superfamily n=1 Tax=Chitinophaga ginsengisegetis TaxID=393003 RepID=A0A1T5NZ00_9BACT|nr:ectonucleotide pyrophosphatase/phosphodiesterase [Chitinophaga ginsengisegetis]SKD05711.1 Predicted pyrophosphatase or phosphodiesterase, AlkP superfamily [Chitinophaga ginsengisegetis]